VSFTHPRAEWQDPKLPVRGPAIDWTRIDTVAVHYTAADDLIDGDPGEHAENLPGYLRAIQRDYMTHRVPPYSIGYGVAVDWLGGSWELRGVDIKCAANKGHNEHTIAILVLVDGNDMATDYAAAEIRRLIAWFEQLARRELAITGHGQLQDPNHPTGCPGSGLRAQIVLGEFSPRWQQKPEPPQPPTPTEDDVKYLHVTCPGNPEILYAFDGSGSHLIGFSSTEDRDKLVAAYGARSVEVSASQYAELVARAAAA